MIKPMLAIKADQTKINFKHPVYIQPKLDGVRCLFTNKGAFSRSGKEFMNLNHIKKDLKKFFEQKPEVILDGELYNHELKNDFEKIISLVRKQKPTKKDRAEAKKLIQYHVYDYTSANPKLNLALYKQRQDNLTCSDIYGDHIKYVETRLIKSWRTVKIKHNAWKKLGYEGSIIRLNNTYKQKRANCLMKVKDFYDSEAIIIGYEEGKGKRTDTLGKFIMQDKKGIQFGCPPGKGFNYKKLKDILDNIDDYIGTLATFTYFERTKAGSYRHPQFKAIRNYE
tara:strand:- start:612 stop:1454 length:843 start_codon:yes stop_codon:yes gene_type:complete